MPNLHALATLAFSFVVFALSVSAAVLGAPRESLFADPGRPDTTIPLTGGPPR